jgi:hypothetical protein
MEMSCSDTAAALPQWGPANQLSRRSSRAIPEVGWSFQIKGLTEGMVTAPVIHTRHRVISIASLMFSSESFNWLAFVGKLVNPFA